MLGFMTTEKRPPKLSREDRVFVENMKTERGRLEMSQEALAEKVAENGVPGFKQMALSRIEAGTRQLGLGEARAIAEALGRTVEDLLQPTHEHQLYRDLWSAHAELARSEEILSLHIRNVRDDLQVLSRALDAFERSEWQTELTGRSHDDAQSLLDLAREKVSRGVQGRVEEAMGDAGVEEGLTRAPAS